MWISGIYWNIQKVSFATRINIDIIVIVIVIIVIIVIIIIIIIIIIILTILLKARKIMKIKIKIVPRWRQVNFLLYGQSGELFQFGWLAK